jgi:predicted small integral membrane protein
MSTRDWKGTPNTFRAVTHVLGRVYVVCWPCKRYAPL